MQTYEILVKDRAIRPNSKDMTLVRTSIGIDQLHVLFDNPEWLDFPITITFAQGEDIISQSLQVTAVADSEWVAEGTVIIPHEVIDMLGPIRVTLQGTDANGRHIITAKGSPLSVEEAGDVIQGIEPSDNPTMDEWYQAYANAVAAANAAASLVANLQAQLDNMISDAEAEIDAKVGESYRPATKTELGAIMVGDGLSITDDGVLSANAKQGGQSIDVSDLYDLADTAFATPFETPVIKPDVLPIATIDSLGTIYPDGTTLVVDQDGMMHATPFAFVPAATNDMAGIVRPDGTTITIDDDGTLHSMFITNEEIDALTPYDDMIPDGDSEEY